MQIEKYLKELQETWDMDSYELNHIKTLMATYAGRVAGEWRESQMF